MTDGDLTSSIKIPEAAAQALTRHNREQSVVSTISSKLGVAASDDGRPSVYKGLAQVHTNLTNLRETAIPDRIQVEDEHELEEEEEEANKAQPPVVVDRCIENQRGWFFFGFPFFSSDSLMPLVDNPPWTSGTGVAISGDATSMLLPDSTWKWSWKRWYVDMSSDVDDQGWSYSWRFGSKSWHGSHLWLHSFVRRRIWIRQREKIATVKMAVSNTQNTPFDVRPRSLSTKSSNDGICDISQLKVALSEARLDRERIRILVDFMCDEKNMCPLWTLVNSSDNYVGTLVDLMTYSDSKNHLLQHIKEAQEQREFSNPEHAEVYQLLSDLIEDYIRENDYYNNTCE